MIIKLQDVEKEEFCVKMGKHLKRLRDIAGFTQDDLESLSGISKERISRMENGAIIMRWSQFICFVMVFSMNRNAKEYLLASKILTPRLLQALQMKDDHVPPDLQVTISESVMDDFRTDFRIASSLTSSFLEHKV